MCVLLGSSCVLFGERPIAFPPETGVSRGSKMLSVQKQLEDSRCHKDQDQCWALGTICRLILSAIASLHPKKVIRHDIENLVIRLDPRGSISAYSRRNVSRHSRSVFRHGHRCPPSSIASHRLQGWRANLGKLIFTVEHAAGKENVWGTFGQEALPLQSSSRH